MVLKKAILIFAKEPLPGRVKTRMTPPLSPEEAAELYACMLGDVISMASSLTAVEKYVFYDGGEEALGFFGEKAPLMTLIPQLGDDLGERMEGAFREVFARGHDAAVIIGSDSPDLPPGFIIEAFARLERPEVDAIFGPCDDGGYYLLGMKRLHPELFSNIAWSSDRVLEESLERAEAAGISVSLLPEWRDLDTAADLTRPELLSKESRAWLTRLFLMALRKREPDIEHIR